jgi:hypothetical protein
MSQISHALCAAIATCLLAGVAHAESDATYPPGWEDWVLVKETVIPDNKTPIPDGIPPLYVETIKTYNWINDGNGTKLQIYVNPLALDAYRTHGPYVDGPTTVGVFEDVGIIFVTEHLLGESLYGTYAPGGKDISSDHASFAPQFCSRCHQGYSEICSGGTCATPVDPLPVTNAAPSVATP